MSETFDEIVRDIGDGPHDPIVDEELLEVIDHARDVEWQLNMSEPTSDDKKRYMAVLDKEWEKWLDDTIVVRGQVYCVPRGTQKVGVLLHDATVISKGFDIVEIEGDTDEQPTYKVAHSILVHPTDVMSPEEIADSAFAGNEPDDMPYISAYAMLDDITIEVKEINPARVLNYIATRYPELEEEIDRRIINAHDALDAVLALKGLDVTEFADCNDETTRNVVITYINSLICIDHDFPLKFVFDEGNIYASTTDECEMSLSIKVRDGDVLHGFVPSLIHFTEMHVDDEPSDDWTLSLDVYSATEDYRERRRHFCIPLDSLGNLQSTRAMFSGSPEGAQ